MPAMGKAMRRGRAHYEKLRHLLRHDCAGVEKVIRSLNHLRRTHPGNKRIAEVLGYLRNNRHRMGYAEAKARHLPIGSGGGGGGVQDVGDPAAEAFGDALASRRGAGHPDPSCAHSKWTFRLGMGVVVRDLPGEKSTFPTTWCRFLVNGRLMEQFRTYTRLALPRTSARLCFIFVVLRFVLVRCCWQRLLYQLRRPRSPLLPSFRE